MNAALSGKKTLLSPPSKVVIHFALMQDCAYEAQLCQLVKVKCIQDNSQSRAVLEMQTGQIGVPTNRILQILIAFQVLLTVA